MSDPTLNYYVARGTRAQRLAFTPTPATPAAGPAPGYNWLETNTGLTYGWDGADWQIEAGGLGTFTVEVPNADMLTLPSTAFDLLPALGANTIIWPIWASIQTNLITAYTNINAGATSGTGCYVTIATADQTTFPLSQLVNGWGTFTGANTNLSEVSDLLGVTGQRFVPIGPEYDGSAGGGGIKFTQGFGMAYGFVGSDTTVFDPTAMENQALQLIAVNSAGNFTGGNAGNVISVNVIYKLVEVL